MAKPKIIGGRMALLLSAAAVALATLAPIGSLEAEEAGAAAIQPDTLTADGLGWAAPVLTEDVVATGTLLPVTVSGAGASGSSLGGYSFELDDADAPDFVQDPSVVEVEEGSAIAALVDDTTPWRSPDDAAERSGIGSEHWNHEGYARTSGNLYAYVELNDFEVSRYLDVHDFDFSIPEAATVTGIEVSIERHADDVWGMSPVRDYSVRLTRGGAVVGENRATDTNYPSIDTYENHGSPTDLWGESWTPADINAHGFGAVLSVKKFGHIGGHVHALVDHIRIRVTYTLDVQEPVAQPPAGTYVGAQEVSLTTPTSTADWSATSIRYTLDGSEPTCATGLEYDGAIQVEEDLTIRALSCYPLGYSSDVASFEYVIQEPPAIEPPAPSSGGGAPLPGGPSTVAQVYEPTPAVLGASTVNLPTPRVLGAATCLSQLDDPMGVVRPDQNLARRLAGRILLKVQACGEAWYLNPVTLRRHKLSVAGAAEVMRSLSLKVTDEQLKRVAVGDIDSRKGKSSAPASYIGRALQAPDGTIWYVSPADGKRYEVTTPDQMLKVMRLLGVGISNVNIAKIQVAE